jgi:hypothetical protein
MRKRESPQPAPGSPPDYVEGERVPDVIGEEVSHQQERKSGGSLKRWGKAYTKGSIIGVAMQVRKSLASFACLLLGVFALASATPAVAAELEPRLSRQTQISGIAQVGQTLTATPAVWVAGRYGEAVEGTMSVWDRCADSSPSSCKIAEPYGGHVYGVTTADVGFVIRAWSTLTIFGWSVGSQSEATAVVTAAPTTPPPTTPTPTPEATAKGTAPTVSAFALTVGVKLSTGVGTLTARCGAPATESCTFSLTLFASVKNGHASSASKVNVGTVTGKLQGGKSGKLALKLNRTGRKYLKRGTIHLEAAGTVKDTAGLVTHFHKRVAVKKK